MLEAFPSIRLGYRFPGRVRRGRVQPGGRLQCAPRSPPCAYVSFPDYDFASHRFEVRPGIRMHYLDEGPRDGEVVLALHGNPSWSYYWRHLVRGLRDRYRVVVP